MSPNYLKYTKVILWKCEYSQAIPQRPHSQILMIRVGGGGPTEVNNLYPKISQLQNLSTQKNHYFSNIPQNIP